MTPKNVENPRYGDVNKASVLLDVSFEELPQHGMLRFYARPTDSEEHGRALYARAIAGEFGPIAAFTADNSPHQ